MKTLINFIITISCFVHITSCKIIKPIAPTVPTIPIPSPQQPNSEIDVPITAELSSYFTQAENSVPNEYGGSDNPCEGVRYSYLFQRSPFIISGSGQSISLNFQGRYRMGGEYCAKCVFGKCVVPKVSFSCGIGEDMRRVEIGYTSNVNILPNYHLQTHTDLTTLSPVDRCKITILNIDITDRLINGVRGPLGNLGNKVDEKTGQLDLRPTVQKFWNKLFLEQRFGEFGFLNINPQSLRLSKLNMNSSKIDFSFGISCTPVLSSNSNPSGPSNVPDLSSNIPGNGFNIYLDVKASYQDITKQINKELIGKIIPVIRKKKIIITNTSFYGIGNSKVVLAIDFKGTRKGTLYFTGTPTFNNINKMITIPDLDFDIKTKNLILKLAKWMFNNKINLLLRQKAQYDLTQILNSAKINAQNELNRSLGDNIEMSGNVNDLSLQDIYPTIQTLLLRVLSNGQVSVKMK